ncbi:MAG: hypothetical protein ACE5E0_03850, partial [Terriglobia bacterium]
KVTFLILVVLAVLLPQAFYSVHTAAAATFKSGETIRLGADETIGDDLYVGAGSVRIDGTVDGDLFVGAGSANIGGEVTGDIIVTGGDVNLNGEVKESARAGGGNVNVNGPIGRDLMVAGGNVNVNGDLGRDLVGAGGNIGINGTVGRDIKVAGGNVVIDGEVKRNVRIEADTVRLGPNARISGNLTYVSREKAKIDPGAVVAGDTRFKARERPTPARSIFRGAGFRVLSAAWSFLALSLVGLIIAVLAPRRLRVTGAKITESPLASAGLGFVLVIVGPAAIFFTFLTVIGIPLGLILTAIFWAAVYLTNVFVGFFLGDKLGGALASGGSVRPISAVLIGVFVLTAVRFVLGFVPFVTILVNLPVMLFGLGAMGLAAYDLHRQAREAELA